MAEPSKTGNTITTTITFDFGLPGLFFQRLFQIEPDLAKVFQRRTFNGDCWARFFSLWRFCEFFVRDIGDGVCLLMI